MILDSPSPSCPEPTLFGPVTAQFGRADPFLPGTVPFWTCQPLLARNRPFLGHMDPFLPRFCTRRSFLARNRPFLDTRTPSCPIFGRANPFSPGIVLFWTHEPLPALFLAALTLSRPESSLFGHMDPFLPTIIPFWTHEPLPALFLAVLTTSCPLIVPFWMSEPFHALFLDVLIILLLELSPFGYMVGCVDPFLTWHCPHPGCYGLF